MSVLQEPERPSEGVPVNGGVSRRAALAAIGVSVGAVSAWEFIGYGPSAAAAEPTWRHPFTFRAAPTQGYDSYDPDSYTNYPYLHRGLDYAPGRDIPIHAVAGGTVDFVDVAASNEWYGNFVRINHGNGFWSSYAHLAAPPEVGIGPIQSSTRLGIVGNTGRPSYGAHLHLEIFQGGLNRHDPTNRVDPFPKVHWAPLATPGIGDDDMYDNAAESRLKKFIEDQARPKLYRNNANGQIAAIHVPTGYVRVFSSIPEIQVLQMFEVIASDAEMIGVDTNTMNGLKNEAALARKAIAQAVIAEMAATP